MTLNHNSSRTFQRSVSTGRLPNGPVQAAKLNAFPNLRKTAEFVGIDPGTLSRKADELGVRLVRRGEREILFSPTVVLQLSSFYRRRDSSEVGADLIDFAFAQAPEFAKEIENEVDDFLDAEVVPGEFESPEQFLQSARRMLPSKVFKEVEAVLRSEHPRADGGSTIMETAD